MRRRNGSPRRRLLRLWPLEIIRLVEGCWLAEDIGLSRCVRLVENVRLAGSVWLVENVRLVVGVWLGGSVRLVRLVRLVGKRIVVGAELGRQPVAGVDRIVIPAPLIRH
jgi:hypothetical protein